jgi:hypothetical protein
MKEMYHLHQYCPQSCCGKLQHCLLLARNHLRMVSCTSPSSEYQTCLMAESDSYMYLQNSPPLSSTIKDKIMSVVMWSLGDCSVPKSRERFRQLVPDYFSSGDNTGLSPKRSVRIDTCTWTDHHPKAQASDSTSLELKGKDSLSRLCYGLSYVYIYYSRWKETAIALKSPVVDCVQSKEWTRSLEIWLSSSAQRKLRGELRWLRCDRTQIA